MGKTPLLKDRLHIWASGITMHPLMFFIIPGFNSSHPAELSLKLDIILITSSSFTGITQKHSYVVCWMKFRGSLFDFGIAHDRLELSYMYVWSATFCQFHFHTLCHEMSPLFVLVKGHVIYLLTYFIYVFLPVAWRNINFPIYNVNFIRIMPYTEVLSPQIIFLSGISQNEHHL